MGYLPEEYVFALDVLEREGLPECVDGFDMEKVISPCGTMRCLYGDILLILKKHDKRVPDMYVGSKDFKIFSYLFSSYWKHTDNTLEGAIARARYVDKFGVPDNWEAQIVGDAPLSYKINIKEMTEKIINEEGVNV